MATITAAFPNLHRPGKTDKLETFPLRLRKSQIARLEALAQAAPNVTASEIVREMVAKCLAELG